MMPSPVVSGLDFCSTAELDVVRYSRTAPICGMYSIEQLFFVIFALLIGFKRGVSVLFNVFCVVRSLFGWVETG